MEDARRVAAALGIPHYVMNFRKEFKEYVTDYFIDEYLHGRTPNPCIACNRYVKWESLLQRSLKIGADYIATGHYARIDRLPDGRYALRTSQTKAKDQTYALYNLTQEQLKRTLMPVGEYTKEEIRRFAGELGLRVADKPDSQDICFVPDGHYEKFIEKYTGKTAPAGNFVTQDGEIIGRHKGIIHYTVGQRRGLGIAAPSPYYVKEIRPESNEVVLCSNEELFRHTLFAEDVNWVSIPEPAGRIRVEAKIRYRHKPAAAVAEMTENGLLKVTFDEPQRAVTKGQSVVLYDGDLVLGGGKICAAE